MNITRRELLVTTAALALVSKANAQGGVEKDTGAQDVVLWYDKPAARWADAVPVGNGRLGAMVFGGRGTGHLRRNLCRSTKTHCGRKTAGRE